MIAVRIDHWIIDLGASMLDHITQILHTEMICDGFSDLSSLRSSLGQMDDRCEESEVNACIILAGTQNHRIGSICTPVAVTVDGVIAAFVGECSVPALKYTSGKEVIQRDLYNIRAGIQVSELIEAIGVGRGRGNWKTV